MDSSSTWSDKTTDSSYTVWQKLRALPPQFDKNYGLFLHCWNKTTGSSSTVWLNLQREVGLVLALPWFLVQRPSRPPWLHCPPCWPHCPPCWPRCPPPCRWPRMGWRRCSPFAWLVGRLCPATRTGFSVWPGLLLKNVCLPKNMLLNDNVKTVVKLLKISISNWLGHVLKKINI